MGESVMGIARRTSRESVQPFVKLILIMQCVVEFMGLVALLAAKVLRHLPSSGTLKSYNDPELVDFIFEKTKSLRQFKPWPEMSGIASVLDFGGGCGHHFFRAVRQSPAIRWAVVETPNMAKRAAELETKGLRFFTDISAALAWLGPPQIVHCDSALQFTDDPVRHLRDLCAIQAPTMIWKRIALSDDETERDVAISLLAENGPGFRWSRKRVCYAVTRMSAKDFIRAHCGYRLEERSHPPTGSQDFLFRLGAATGNQRGC